MSNHTFVDLPSWKVELTSRIQKFASIIKVNPDIVLQKLSDLGVDIENESSLEILEDPSCLPISDLFTVFVDAGLTKKALIRLGVKQLYGQTKEIETETSHLASALQTVISSNRPKSEMTDKELLELYSQEEAEVIDILRKRSHGRYFIVFDNNKVDIEKSLHLLKIAKFQSLASTHLFGQKIHKLYRAGDFPVVCFEASPFYDNTILQDGYCPRSNTQWRDISEEARILIRIYVKHVEKKELSQMEMKHIVAAANDLNKLKELLNAAVPIYDYMKDRNQLPSLKVYSKNSDRPTGNTDTGF